MPTPRLAENPNRMAAVLAWWQEAQTPRFIFPESRSRYYQFVFPAPINLTWPSTLPQAPQAGDWTETPQRNVASFQPEVGPPKYRRRNTANGTVAEAVFMMTAAQVATFNDFYQNTLIDGVLPFNWAHPITGVVYSWIFAQAPPANAQYFNWNRVSVQLIRLP